MKNTNNNKSNKDTCAFRIWIRINVKYDKQIKDFVDKNWEKKKKEMLPSTSTMLTQIYISIITTDYLFFLIFGLFKIMIIFEDGADSAI